MPNFAHTQWARTRDDPQYHTVTFRAGPHIHEETARCGLHARFWPRIGVRMDDPYCPICWDSVVAEARAAQQSPSPEGGESEHG